MFGVVSFEVMRATLTFLAVLIAGCPSSNRSVAPAASQSAANASVSASTVASVTTTLPAPPTIASAAIRVVGYPLSVSVSMNDPAHVVGFTTDAFASLVYNDTGFRHHQKGEYARAAELFTKAAAADPSAKLPPYNLACAWARLKDPRAKDALVVALAIDPDVKRRARTDADFASVKDEAWFTAVIPP